MKTNAEVYDDVYRRDPTYGGTCPRHAPIIREILHGFGGRVVIEDPENPPRDDQRCSYLDVGCGSGAIALEVWRAGHNVFGFDCSQVAIDKLLAEYESIKNSGYWSFHAVRRDAETFNRRALVPGGRELPWYGTFDIVGCSDVLEHVESRSSVIDIAEACIRAARERVVFSVGLRRAERLGHVLHHHVLPPDEWRQIIVGAYSDAAGITPQFRDWEENSTYFFVGPGVATD